MSPPLPLVLASTSAYRRELLQRLAVPFETRAPEVDESPLAGESPATTAERLAVAKARAPSPFYPNHLIIGSDQVAYLGQQRFDKPLYRERALEQLRQMRGQVVTFHTAICLYNSGNGRTQLRAVPTEVRFRNASDEEIERYVDREQPFDCAGSAKSEGLGISLLDYIRGDDPNALVGLPLIALCDMLRGEGIELP